MRIAWVFLLGLTGSLSSLAEIKVSNIEELKKLAESGNSDALCLLGLQNILGGNLMDPRLITTMSPEQIIQNKLPLFRKKVESLIFAEDATTIKAGNKLQESYNLFLRSSENNNRYGYYLAGILQINGIGTQKNKMEGFKKIKKAADLGLAKAQTSTADFFWCGTGVDPDRTQSFRYYNLAFEQGDAEAAAQLGWLYQYGQGVEKNISKAVQYFERSAASNDPFGLVYLGRCYLDGEGKEKNPEKGFELIKQASKVNGYGKTWLGRFYYKGNVVEKDERKAFELFKEGKEEGDLFGLYMVGECYDGGFGTIENDQKAVEIFKKAVEYDSPEACWALGRKYFFGKGVEKDTNQASQLFEKGAALGDTDSKWWIKDLSFLRGLAEKNDPEAQQFLGSRLREGWFTQKHIEEGNEWLERAVQNGSGTAAALLGESFEKGDKGKPKDLQRANKYFKKGAEIGDKQCLSKLGYNSFHGIGMPKDPKQAANYYREAVKLGDVPSAFYLADLYRFGIGVEEKQSKAFELYNKVMFSDSISENMQNDARAKAGTYYLDGGSVVQKDISEAVALFQKSIQGKAPSSLGMFFLGYCMYYGLGIDLDKKRGTELIEKAALLGQAEAIQAMKDIRSGKKVTF